MKLNVNFEIFDLNDKAVPEKASRFIAEMLLEHKGDSLKLYELAIKINKNESIEIDTTDLKLIEDAVKGNPKYTNLVKGAILKEIESQKFLSNK
jgi:acyl carrier protein